MGDAADDYYDSLERREYEDDEVDLSCPTCKGRGVVNPLTAPADFFCVGSTDCPHCDGTGEIQ